MGIRWIGRLGGLALATLVLGALLAPVNGPPAYASVAAVPSSDAAHRTDVFVRGTDGALWHGFWDGETPEAVGSR